MEHSSTPMSDLSPLSETSLIEEAIEAQRTISLGGTLVTTSDHKRPELNGGINNSDI